MEHIKGISLADLYKKKFWIELEEQKVDKMKELRVIVYKILQQIALALYELSKLNLQHRDLHGGNIILDL